jgi:hypothetical protein
MKKLRINWYIVKTDVDRGADDGVEQGVEWEKGMQGQDAELDYCTLLDES